MPSAKSHRECCVLFDCILLRKNIISTRILLPTEGKEIDDPYYTREKVKVSKVKCIKQEGPAKA